MMITLEFSWPTTFLLLQWLFCKNGNPQIHIHVSTDPNLHVLQSTESTRVLELNSHSYETTSFSHDCCWELFAI